MRIVLACGAMLAGAIAAGTTAHADEVTEACAYVSRQVGVFEGGIYREMPDTFEDEGRIYRGCVVTILGDSNKLPDRAPPAERPYPNPGSAPAKAGWKADRQADGPDGTSYRIFRGRVFCLVSAVWDGGDPTEPKVIPSSLFLITARCARMR